MHIETALLKGATPDAINELRRQLGNEALAIYCAYYRSLEHFPKEELNRIKDEIQDALFEIDHGDFGLWGEASEEAIDYLLNFHQVRHWKYRQWLDESGFQNHGVFYGSGRHDHTWIFLSPLAELFYARLPSYASKAPHDYWIRWLSNDSNVEGITSSLGRRLGYTGSTVAWKLLEVCATGDVIRMVLAAQQYIERRGRAELPSILNPQRLLDLKSLRQDYEESLESIQRYISIENGKRFFRNEKHINVLKTKAETLVSGFPRYLDDLETLLKSKGAHLATWERLDENLTRKTQLELIDETIGVLIQGIPEEFFLAKKEKDLLGD